jgi:hypothetical protein
MYAACVHCLSGTTRAITLTIGSTGPRSRFATEHFPNTFNALLSEAIRQAVSRVYSLGEYTCSLTTEYFKCHGVRAPRKRYPAEIVSRGGAFVGSESKIPKQTEPKKRAELVRQIRREMKWPNEPRIRR